MVRIYALAALAFLAACGDSGTEREAVHDVEYYVEHPEERDAMTAQCENNPGEIGDTANCRNAREADRKSLIDEIKAATGANEE